ncbi:MAG: peptidylprolyl isomerase [Bacteroidales bacterium]|nr:peptidylprolyl isomerase [Bacteroidales bacterium]
MKIIRFLVLAILATAAYAAWAQNNIAEEVAWMIGDEPIYKSEVEQAYKEYLEERIPIKGDPYCVIPEQIAIQRLYLHQADLDTIEAQTSYIQQRVDQQVNYLIAQLGSREKVEQYFRRTIPELREMYQTNFTNRSRMEQVQENLTKDFKATPSDVRKYFNSLPTDSIPFVPLQVEVQVVAINPSIPRQEIEDVKARLREFSDRVTSGEAEFSTLAILYSEDPGSAARGGELGFMGRGELVPEYAAVAFNLNDTKKVSKIVESEYGYHIIQLIEKRGDRINTRHILLKPKVADKDLIDAVGRLDSLRVDIVDNKKITFEEAARYYSQDKDTRYSNGVMVNDQTGTTRFEMSQLPQEIAKKVATMQPGEISEAFIMKDPKRDRDQVVLIKLTNRIEAHKANLAEDYQLILDMYEMQGKQKILDKWIANKIKTTYVKIEDGWKGCDFEHEGWIK